MISNVITNIIRWINPLSLKTNVNADVIVSNDEDNSTTPSLPSRIREDISFSVHDSSVLTSTSFASYDEAKKTCERLNLSLFKKTIEVDHSRGGGNAKYLRCSDFEHCRYSIQLRKSTKKSESYY